MREAACFFLAVFRVFAILSPFAPKIELECGGISENLCEHLRYNCLHQERLFRYHPLS